MLTFRKPRSDQYAFKIEGAIKSNICSFQLFSVWTMLHSFMKRHLRSTEQFALSVESLVFVSFFYTWTVSLKSMDEQSLKWWMSQLCDIKLKLEAHANISLLLYKCTYTSLHWLVEPMYELTKNRRTWLFYSLQFFFLETSLFPPNPFLYQSANL